MRGELLIRSVRPWPSSAGTPEVDVLCRDGRIHTIGTGLSAPEGVRAVDGGGGVLLPSFVDAHGRLDSLRPGTTMIRTHVSIDDLDKAVAAKQALADRVEVQIAVMPAYGTSVELTGADLVGGIDPVDDDLDALFALADKHQLDLDVQLVEVDAIELVCQRVRALDLRGHVTVSHALPLSKVDGDRQDELIDLLAEADVAVAVTQPLPLRKLRWGGVRVGLGGCDLWELATAEGYTAEPMIEMCADTATRGGAAVLGERDHGLVEGDRAELMVLPGDTVAEVISQRREPTLVVHAGRVV